MLLRPRCNNIRLTRIVDDRAARDSDPAWGGDDTAAPVAEAIAVGSHGNRRICRDVIGNEKVGRARIVNIQHQQHRRRLRAVVDQLVAYPDLHAASLEASHLILSRGGRPGQVPRSGWALIRGSVPPASRPRAMALVWKQGRAIIDRFPL